MPDPPGTARMIGQLSTVGLSFVLALVLGFGGGSWVDEQLGTAPWLAFVGFFLGLAAGILNVYRVMQGLGKR
jgi:ATP synthase protein I